MEWNNAGVAPSAEKQQTGYAAGEKLPAGHINWFFNQFFSFMNAANTQLSGLPMRIDYGVYTGDGGKLKREIVLGYKPIAVIVVEMEYNSSFWGVSRNISVVFEGHKIGDYQYITDEEGNYLRTHGELSISNNGFEVSGNYSTGQLEDTDFNSAGDVFRYIAFGQYPTIGE